MRNRTRFLQCALGAWEMLSDLRLPGVSVSGRQTAESLVCFPLWGALCGVLGALVWKAASLLTNRIAGAAVFAVAVCAFMLAKDSCRGVKSLGLWAVNGFKLGSLGAALKQLSPARGDDDQNVLLASIACALAEFVLLLLLGRYRAVWYLPFVLAGGFTVQGALAAEFGLVADPDRRNLKKMWIAFGVIGLLSFLVFPLSTVIGAVAVYALAVPAVKFIRANVAAPGADIVTLWGSLAELALLLSGFFWTIRLG